MKKAFTPTTCRFNDILMIMIFLEDLLALVNPKYLQSIKKAREEYKKGEYYIHEEVFAES